MLAAYSRQPSTRWAAGLSLNNSQHANRHGVQLRITATLLTAQCSASDSTCTIINATVPLVCAEVAAAELRMSGCISTSDMPRHFASCLLVVWEALLQKDMCQYRSSYIRQLQMVAAAIKSLQSIPEWHPSRSLALLPCHDSVHFSRQLQLTSKLDLGCLFSWWSLSCCSLLCKHQTSRCSTLLPRTTA